jgi:type IV pilus assembly protein PilN
MPKINLLQQAAADAAGAKAKPISTQTTQQLVMLIVVLFGVVTVIFFDFSITNRENDRVKNDLAQEQKVAQELSKLKEDGEELQRKIALVENRIKVIKQLRAEQRGPVAVLSQINERIPIGVKLDSITQRDNLMTVIGTTNTEGLITSFSKELEFSRGLFSDFNVQTELIPAAQNAEQSWRFTIRCKYNPPTATQTPEANQTASNTN